jgi:hypothetical protein
MAANKTIRKAVCDKCGHVADSWNVGRSHKWYGESNGCDGTFEAKQLPKEVLVGEFVFARSYGKHVYLKHVETGREVMIFTIDLLNVLMGRGLGKLTLTESKRGDQHCWKAQEVSE